MPHLVWFYVEDFFQHHVVGIVDDLGSHVGLISVIIILDAAIDNIQYSFMVSVVSSASSNLFWFSLMFVSVIFPYLSIIL